MKKGIFIFVLFCLIENAKAMFDEDEYIYSQKNKVLVVKSARNGENSKKYFYDVSLLIWQKGSSLGTAFAAGNPFFTKTFISDPLSQVWLNRLAPERRNELPVSFSVKVRVGGDKESVFFFSRTEEGQECGSWGRQHLHTLITRQISINLLTGENVFLEHNSPLFTPSIRFLPYARNFPWTPVRR